ncbi:MAG: hypothetical protein RSG77_22590 [Hafnia sp.]
MKLIYPEETTLNKHLTALIERSAKIDCRDYLYFLGSVLADKMLPKLDPSRQYTLVSCAEDLDDFNQGFSDRIDHIIQFSHVVFWISPSSSQEHEVSPIIRHRYVEKEYIQSHEVIFIRPFIIDPELPKAIFSDVIKRIKPAKLHTASVFVDEQVGVVLAEEFGADCHFEEHCFVRVNKSLGERPYVWARAEKDMYKSLAAKSFGSAVGTIPETIMRKMIVRK